MIQSDLFAIYESTMKYIILSLSLFLFFGCSKATLQTAWDRTKDASYTAATDPVTWAPLATGVTLYTTKTDDHITNYLMKHPVLNSKDDSMYRDINGFETYITAVVIDDNDSETKFKRIAVEVLGFSAAKTTTDLLNASVEKENPSKTQNNAIGSHHSVDTFTGSAMNRRNVAQLAIPDWKKYSLNGLSYFTAAASAYARIQEGGHSLGDQCINASIGNFIGLFIHDLFMKEDTHIQMSVQNDSAYLYTNWQF